ncbi:DUF4252 domain-containing protein [Algibacter sp. AS12]|uniref:DUF4252 domain-containing protein n=1 Tax=Algibacter sp. AS12 TaxID=3135773 RepID=UPI00398A54CD
MKRTIKLLAIALITVVSFTSCGNDVSLQRYFVDHQETKNFISQDFPLSMIEIDKSNFTEAQEEAYNSVDKLNFLGYKSDSTDLETFNTEVARVKAILSNSKYNDLMEFSDRGNKIAVKYLGDDENTDEFIVFGSHTEMGFGIVRVLGDDMNPEKMITLMETMKQADLDKAQLDNIMNFFK